MLELSSHWRTIQDCARSDRGLTALMLVAVVGGLGVAIASEVGVRHFTTDWHKVMGYNPQPDRGWNTFVLLWIALAAAPLIQGVVGALLLPLYRHRRQWRATFAVAIVGTIPLYIAGLSLVLLPGILLVVIAFLVSCSWWSSGSQELLGIPPSESPDFVAVMLIGSAAALFLLSAVFP